MTMLLKNPQKIVFLLLLTLSFIFKPALSKESDFTRINDPELVESLKKNLFLKAISEPEDGLVYELYLDLDQYDHDNIQGVFRVGDEQPLYYSMDKMLEKRELSLCHKFFDTMFLGVDQNFSKNTGGTIYLKYLHNFFSLRNKFKIHKFKLKKVEGKWQLFSKEYKNKRVKKVILKSKKQLGKVVGINNVEERFYRD